MAVDLYPLIQLHFLDQKISVLQQRISRIPTQLQDIDRKLERFLSNVQQKQAVIAENQKKRRELEGDLALVETKRNRYKEQLDTVKTNKEYTALQHEIELVSQAIRQIEDQILGQMEEAEHLKSQLDEAQRAKEKEEGVLIQEKDVVQAEANRLQGAMDDLKQQRERWIEKILPAVLEIYSRVAMHRRGIAMAEAKNEMCQECQMRIRPQLFQEIRRNDTIITCESCSRILFYMPQDNQQNPES